MAGGRPTDYDPKICETLPDMFKDGQSVLEVAAQIGVHKDTLYEWAKVHPEFSAAFTRGRQIAQAWWERQGRLNLFDTEEYDSKTKISTKKRFNDRLWNKNVSCRFRADWTDKTDISIETGPLEIKVTHETEGI